MPRTARIAPGGLVYHVLNRSVGKMKLFRHDGDYQAFLRVVAEAHKLHPIRILSHCVLSNHWHFVVWPQKDTDVTNFFRWLAHTHAMRWRVAHHTVGYGHLYQGRFKSFAVQTDEHLLTVCRYVERNALSAGLVKHAQDWRYGSLWTRMHGSKAEKELLTDWPVDRPRNWVKLVNTPLTGKETERMKSSLERGRPFGNDEWILRMAARLKAEHTLHPKGRPEKKKEDNSDGANEK